MKLTPADIWFSKCVRERAEWTCELCNVMYRLPSIILQCSHFKKRDFWAVRTDPENAIALCSVCHKFVERKKKPHRELHVKIFGEDVTARVEASADDLMLAKAMKQTEGKGKISKHYRDEFRRMEELRAAGVTGRIEFVGFGRTRPSERKYCG